MATDVVIPQLGTSIARVTIRRWLVEAGDTVERDQPLFEISTDKVDAEIPSPAAGVLLEILHQGGETVPVYQVVARIDPAGLAAAPAGPAREDPPEKAGESDETSDVVMPQLGEWMAEGTISRWLVQVGDTVERDQPLFEIATDKVDAEIPSPTAGVLLEILHQEGETVPVHQPVARIGPTGAASMPPVRPGQEHRQSRDEGKISAFIRRLARAIWP